jgi:RND family efflux transporter MFP subunit
MRLASGLLLFGCLGCRPAAAPSAHEAPAATPPVPVPVATADLQLWPRVVQVQGSFLADEHAVIGAKVAGRVKSVLVDMGMRVQADAVLATLEPEDFDLRVRQAEAELEQACAQLGLKPNADEAALDRSGVPAVQQELALRNQAKISLQRGKALAPQHAITAAELDQLQANFEVAEARVVSALNNVERQMSLVGVCRADLALAKQARLDAEVRAPFGGMVEARYVAPGTYLQVGQPVIHLVRIDPLRFRAGVPERQAQRLATKQPATIRVEGQTNVLQGEISRLSPTLETANRSLTIEIDIPNPTSQLRVGLFAEAEIVVEPEARTLAIPAAALREFAGVEKVWVVRDGQAAEQVVQTGRRTKEAVEVLKGLTAGDLVVSPANKGQAGPVVAQSEGRKPKEDGRRAKGSERRTES